MAIINVALSDTFDQWRTKTNTLGTNQGDLASLDAGFAGSDLVSCLNELRSGEDLTQLILGDSSGVGNNRIKLGDSADMHLYHDGSNSFIEDTGTGSLITRANRTRIQSDGGENQIECIANGTVELYYDTSKKLETTATGINVTGEVDMDILKMPDVTSGNILIADGGSYQEQNLTGDATLTHSGTLTIANDAVNAAKIAAGAVGASEIAAGAVGASEIADGSITSTEFSSAVTLQIKNSSGTVLKTLRSPGS